MEKKRKRGAPFGNKNAIGNRGGGAPRKNKNAVKNGIYSKIIPEELEGKEAKLYDKYLEQFHYDYEIAEIMLRFRRFIETKQYFVSDFESYSIRLDAIMILHTTRDGSTFLNELTKIVNKNQDGICVFPDMAREIASSILEHEYKSLYG